jgi:hypothetical protein
MRCRVLVLYLRLLVSPVQAFSQLYFCGPIRGDWNCTVTLLHRQTSIRQTFPVGTKIAVEMAFPCT